MPPATPVSAAALIAFLRNCGPGGAGIEAIQKHFPQVSRSTLTRRLGKLLDEGSIKVVGRSSSTRYLAPSGMTYESVNAYFEKSHVERPVARFDEALLQPTPGIDPEKVERLERLDALAPELDRRFLSQFLIDLSFGSQLLEGGTYTHLDTQALITYGQANKGKPLEDAVLVLAHQEAIKYLWDHMTLNLKTLCALNARLTDHHNVEEAVNSDHFLPADERGQVREYKDVRLNQSAYLPPFRPATGYIGKALDQIIETARSLSPVQAAFYLLTRLPYLQPFGNGNKRTSRLAANIPLLAAGLLPISFVDFDRAEYIRGMAAFYELGSTLIIEKNFVESYLRSIIRSSAIPVRLREKGLDIDTVGAGLQKYVMKGVFPEDGVAKAFIRKGRRG